MIAIAFTIISCYTTSLNKRSENMKSKFKKLDWLIGTWKGYEKGQPFYESWQRMNDTLIANYEISIVKNDTAINEGSSFRILQQEIILGDLNGINWKVDSINNGYVRVKNDSLKSNKMITWKHSPDGHWLTLNLNGTIRYDMILMPSFDNSIRMKLKKQKQNQKFFRKLI